MSNLSSLYPYVVPIQVTILTEKGDIVYSSAANTPAALHHGAARDLLRSGGHNADPFYEAVNLIGPDLHTGTAKNPPIDADEVVFLDSVGGTWALVKATWTQVKAFLKTYFDGLYALIASPTFTGTVTIGDANGGNLNILAKFGTELAPAMTQALWTEGAGWTINDGLGTATRVASAVTTMVPTTPIVPSIIKDYRVLFTISGWTAGTITCTLGGTESTPHQGNQAVSLYVSPYTTGNLIFTPSATFAGVITLVSVKELSEGTLTVENEIIHYDSRGHQNRLSHMVQHLNEMTMDTLLDKSRSSLSCTGGVLTYTLYAILGKGTWNFNGVVYPAPVASASVVLTGGTDLAPVTNYVYFILVGNTPTLTASAIYPTEVHIDVATFIIGAVAGSSYTSYAYSRNRYEVDSFIKRVLQRFEESGTLYIDGMLSTVTSTALSIAVGNFMNGIFKMTSGNTVSRAGGFFYIDSTGWIQSTSLADLHHYADGTAMAANERQNIVWGIVPTTTTAGGTVATTVRLVAVLQTKPTSVYTNDSQARQDVYECTNYYPPNAELKNVFVPVCRTIVHPNSSVFITFDTGIYYKDCRGKITSGGGAPAVVPTIGILEGNLVAIDSATVADNEYAKFTATGLESMSYAEVLGDIAAVPTARTITATSPVTIDGGASADLSANRTIAIPAASTGTPGHMTGAYATKLDGIADSATRIPIAVAAGTVDAITANFTPDIALNDKTVCMIEALGANTSTTPTFNPDGLGARTITKGGGTALAAGDIAAEHMICILEYNLSHTRWELLNPIGAVPSAHNIFSTSHGDIAAAALPVDGDVIIGNATPKWSKLAISIPAANVLNVLGITNGELRPSWKTLFDSTNPAALGSVTPGTSLIAAHSDHVHALPAMLSDGDKGDITVGGTGTTLIIEAEAVTFAKMQHIATQRVLGRITALAGDVEEITIGIADNNMVQVDDASVSSGDYGRWTAAGLEGVTHETVASEVQSHIKLDDLATPDANTDLNANTTNHGLLLQATAPAAGLMNFVGITNAETVYLNKPLFDVTTPSDLGTVSAGTALTAARIDHVHNIPSEPAPVGTISMFGGIALPAGWLMCDGSAASRSTYATLYNAITIDKGTVTFDITKEAATLIGHGLITGDCIELTTTGTLPTGLSINTNYYVVYSTANVFYLTETYNQAIAGTYLLLLSGANGSGHSLRYCPYKISTSTKFLLPDFRGVFPRGEGAGNSILTNANAAAFAGGFGAYQNDKIQGHAHRQTIGNGAAGGTQVADWNGRSDLANTVGYFATNVTAGTTYGLATLGATVTDDINGNPRAGTETNPANLGVKFMIKYR